MSRVPTATPTGRHRRVARQRRLGIISLLGLVATLVPFAIGATAQPAAAAPSLPNGFFETVVFDGLTGPTAMEFAKDGQVFVAEHNGRIKSFSSLEDRTPDLVADLSASVHNFWDRGLLGMALDPDYPDTPHIYVLYTYDYNPASETHDVPSSWGDACPTPPGATADGCVVTGRLSRLTVSSGVATAEEVLIQDWCQQYPSHSVGDLAFGPDGALYASAGEGAAWGFADYGQRGVPVNPCGDPPGGVPGASVTPPTAEGGALRAQDLRTPGDPVGLSGSIIRIDPTTGEGMPDNPLASSSDENARRIIAHGMRNPFRFAHRPGTAELWVGDVGWGGWEEINTLVSPPAEPANFGWPCYEGTAPQGAYRNLGLDICQDLYDETGAHTPPYLAYQHGENVAGEECGTAGGSLSGLAFQHSEGSSFPAEYDGALFFADYARRCIWVALAGPDGRPDPAAVRPFMTDAARPVQLRIGPAGDLFYVGFAAGAPGAGTIHRISYGDAPPPSTNCATAGDAALLGVDVGAPTPPGSTSNVGDQWTVRGSGADIWDEADSFHFACRSFTGDGSITVRVTNQTNTHPWAKAGVMLRASTAPNAAHGMVVITPGNGVAFQYRNATGMWTRNIAGPAGAAPHWLRLTRSGDTLSASSSANGTQWTQIGSVTVPLGQTPLAGLAVTSHRDAVIGTATFDSLQLPGTPPTSGPRVTIASPGSALRWTVGDEITFSGSANDADGSQLPPSQLTWTVLLQHCSRATPTDCHEHNVESFSGVSSGSFVAPEHDYPSRLELPLDCHRFQRWHWLCLRRPAAANGRPHVRHQPSRTRARRRRPDRHFSVHADLHRRRIDGPGCAESAECRRRHAHLRELESGRHRDTEPRGPGIQHHVHGDVCVLWYRVGGVLVGLGPDRNARERLGPLRTRPGQR